MPRFVVTGSVLRWLEGIFSERFGHTWRLSKCSEGFRLHLVGAEGAIVFSASNRDFCLLNRSDQLIWCNLDVEGFHSALGGPIPAPGYYQFYDRLVERRGGEHFINYDIPSLMYWMLARLEEIGRVDLDTYQRFPATSSHAYNYGYLDRPVVDEWMHLLKQVIQRQWPGLDLKSHKFSVRVTHDVDQPSLFVYKRWGLILRMMARYIVKKRDPKSFVLAPYVKLATRSHLLRSDPYNTFDWLMDVSDKNNLKSAFYFICGKTDQSKDADYDIRHPLMRNLLRKIYSRGHEIGLHPSYNTYKSPELLKLELDRLLRVCHDEGIEQSQLGARMHYLRWEQPTTMRTLAALGFFYDATLGYADYAGFRCGTCHEYPAFDAVGQKQLNLRIRPLILMECSVIDPAYMGLGMGDEALRAGMKLKKACNDVDGCFHILWHNSYFHLPILSHLYLRLVRDMP